MNNKMENWKDIKGYEGFYQVSNLGNVKSLARDIYYQNGIVHRTKEKILVPGLNNKGYQYVNLYKKGKVKSMLIHRLVAMAFLPNPENKPMVNHKDENPLNNCVDNLEWCTASFNINYGTRNIRMVQNRRYPKLGNHPRAKAIFCEELNKTFDCAKRAGEELGIDVSSIVKVCKGKAKIAGKLHWRYASEND